jgi:hypothetical protein
MLLLLSMQLPWHAAPLSMLLPLGYVLLSRDMLLSCACYTPIGNIHIFKCSIHGPLIRQIGIYIMGGFSKSGSQFKFLHTIKKNTLDIYQYMFYKYLFFSKIPFVASHKHIFLFFVPFQQFQDNKLVKNIYYLHL